MNVNSAWDTKATPRPVVEKGLGCQLLKISFSMAYSSTMAAVVPGTHGPTVQIHVCLQWGGAGARPVLLKLTLNGIVASVPLSHGHCTCTSVNSTHFPSNDEDILYKNTTF